MEKDSFPSVPEVESLLAAADAAIPRVADPHPCSISCCRVGGPMDIGPDGKCVECSRGPTFCRPRALAELVAARPDLVLAVCEGYLLMRRTLDHPAVMAAAHAAHS